MHHFRLYAPSLFALVLAAGLYPSTSRALDFELGAGASATVIRISDEDEHKNRAVIANRTSLVPYLALVGSEYYPFENFNLGISWQFWGSTYETYRQEVDNKFEDIDTKLSGIYFYALPILYYRIGDKNDETERNYRISIGLGYGVSYATMKGDVRITGVNESQSLENRPLETVDTQQLFYSAGVFFRGEISKYFLQVSAYTPQVTHGDYIYRISNVNWVLGRKFNIDLDLDFL